MALDPRRARPAPPPPPPPRVPLPTETYPDSTRMGLDGTNDTQVGEAVQEQRPQEQEGGYKLKFCTVCASNQNRSMEAHLRLATAPSPFPTISFGTGSLVRLPGPSLHQPNVYNFNTTSYNSMYEELSHKDPRLYKANGLLNMLDRNRNVKWGPERFQDWVVGVPRLAQAGLTPQPDQTTRVDKGAHGVEGGVVDVIFTCEERCWDAVVDDLLNRGSPLNRPVHVFNVDIKDNHEEALVGGSAILELANELNRAANEERQAWAAAGGQLGGSAGFDSAGPAARAGFDERVPDILGVWQERWPHLPAIWTLAWF